MHSVSSNAVYNETRNMDTWSDSGITVRRIGKIVELYAYVNLSGDSPKNVVTIPEKYRPIVSVRICFMNNSNDEPSGQLIVRENGVVMFYNQNDNNFEADYVGSTTYFAAN